MLVLVKLVDNCAVALVDVEFGLQAVLLFVEEVHLVLQLQHDFFIGLLVVLHVDTLHVLATLVETAKSQNFNISNFNRVLKLFDLGFQSKIRGGELFVSGSHFGSPFICAA